MSSLVKLLAVLALLAAAVGWYVFGPGGRRTDHRAEAVAAAGRRDFAAARDHLDHYLATHPSDPDACLLAAHVARRLGDAVSAVDHVRRYADAGGDREVAELERALGRIESGDPAGSGAVYQFCQQHPDHPVVPQALESLSIGMRKIGQPDRAINCAKEWHRIAATREGRAAARVEWGLGLELKGLGADAGQQYREAVAIAPASTEARFRLAEFLTRDEPDAALALYLGLDAARSDRADVRLGMARCYRLLGDHAAAADLVGPLVRSRPDDPDVLTEAGTLALDRGKGDESEDLLRRAVAKAPDRRVPNVQLLRCLQERGKAAEAEAQRARLKQIDDALERRIAAMSGKQ